MPLNSIYWAFVALWGGYFVLAIYFDSVRGLRCGVLPSLQPFACGIL